MRLMNLRLGSLCDSSSNLLGNLTQTRQHSSSCRWSLFAAPATRDNPVDRLTGGPVEYQLHFDHADRECGAAGGIGPTGNRDPPDAPLVGLRSRAEELLMGRMETHLYWSLSKSAKGSHLSISATTPVASVIPSHHLGPRLLKLRKSDQGVLRPSSLPHSLPHPFTRGLVPLRTPDKPIS